MKFSSVNPIYVGAVSLSISHASGQVLQELQQQLPVVNKYQKNHMNSDLIDSDVLLTSPSNNLDLVYQNVSNAMSGFSYNCMEILEKIVNKNQMFVDNCNNNTQGNDSAEQLSRDVKLYPNFADFPLEASIVILGISFATISIII